VIPPITQASLKWLVEVIAPGLPQAANWLDVKES
jgi:hypothetical protein